MKIIAKIQINKIMAFYIPRKCSKCGSDMILTVAENKNGSPKGTMRGKCLKCFKEQIYYLDAKVKGNKDDVGK